MLRTTPVDPASHLVEVGTRDLEPEGDNKAPEGLVSVETKQSLNEATCTPTEQAQMMDSDVELDSRVSGVTILKKCQMPVQRRRLPRGIKRHAAFLYFKSDIDWVNTTVEALCQDYGFVCDKYDLEEFRGLPLFDCLYDIFITSYKIFVIYGFETLQSRHIVNEIETATMFSERIVPILLDDCNVRRMDFLNYVDARDSMRRDIWWPKLLMELEAKGDHKSSGGLTIDEMKQLIREETSTETEQGEQMMDSVVELDSRVSGVTILKKCQMPVQRHLPRGIKRHAAFFYFKSDIDWVNETVEALHQDYGFVCGKYDLEEFRGLPLFDCLYDIFITSYKIFVIYGFETLQSRHIVNEIETATMFSERIVPILLDDCNVRRMDFLNYVDARDSMRRDIWWPKLLMELEAKGDYRSSGGLTIDEMKQLVRERTSIGTDKGVKKMDSDVELDSRVSGVTILKKCQMPVQRRRLPRGIKRHAAFFYFKADRDWVNKTVEALDQDYGFVCDKYDLEKFRGLPLFDCLYDIFITSNKTFVIYGFERLQSRHILNKIKTTTILRERIVPILLDDCNVGRMDFLNYVDARDSIRREIWWPKLLMELEAKGDYKSSGGLTIDEMKLLDSEETSTETKRRLQKMGSDMELYSTVSGVTILKKCQMPVQRQRLPRGIKRHAAFFYFEADRDWVNKTVEVLYQDYGFVCDKYDLEEFRGFSLFVCLYDIFITSYKIFVIYGFETLQSRQILDELETTTILSGMVVPILLDDCHVGRMNSLNYVDARDSIRRDIWWPMLLMELEVEGDHKSSGGLTIDEMKQLVREETSTEKEQGVQKMDSDVELHSTVSGVKILEKCQLPVQRRRLPRGIKRHAAFLYFKSDRDWVNETVEALDQDYGFVCDKYDLEAFRGLSLFVCLYNIFITSYKIFVIYGFEDFQSRQILDELERTTILSEMVVPILLDDCHVGRMNSLNYVDARESIRRDIWWPKLLMELEGKDHKSSGGATTDEMKQIVREETSTEKEQGVQKMDSDVELNSTVTGVTILIKSKMPVQRRRLPQGTKRHAAFFYFKSERDWVNTTVEALDQDYGFVCDKYDLEEYRGLPLFDCLYDIFITSYKIFVIYGFETHQSRQILDELETTTILSEMVVPILLDDCSVGRMDFLNYVDARESIRRDIWWPKLLMELEAKGDHKSSGGLTIDEMKQLVREETSTEKEQRGQKMDSDVELHSTVTGVTIHNKCKMHVQRRRLPRGIKRHAAFFYFKSERHWVNATVEALDQDYGFVCDKYDLEEFRGLPLFVCIYDIFITSYKIFVIYGFETRQSRQILDELETTTILSKRVVQILLDDCHVGRMDYLNYVDARDFIRKDIWWHKLLMELEAKGDHKSSKGLTIDEMKQRVREKTSTEKEQKVQKMCSDVELHSTVSGVTIVEKCQMPVQRLRLPRGIIRHAAFFYFKSERHWVNKTVEALDQDYGFVCGKYDLEEFRGLPLLVCVFDIFITSYKIFVIYGFETLQSRQILDELETTTILSAMVVPILLDDCHVGRMDFLNYVDARDSIRRDIWWPKLLMELQVEGDHKSSGGMTIDEMKQRVREETSTEKEQGVQKMGSDVELHSAVSGVTIVEKCQKPVQRRRLPRGIKHHAAFFYFESDRDWVNKTVEALDQDYGIVCGKYDLEEFRGLPLFVCLYDIFITSYNIFVIYGFETLQSRQILDELERTTILSKRVVQILLDDCHVGRMDFLNYVDARDSIRRDIWWPMLLMELQVEGDHRSSGVLTIDEMKQLVREEESTEKEQGVQKMGSDVELHSTVSGVTIVEKCQKPVQRRRLPRGIKHHAAFFYFESDRDWVNKTVEALDQDYGIVCGRYDLEEFRGLSLFVCLHNIFITSYKIFVIYGFETLQSRQILDELERTTILSKRVVPILLDDCHVGRMDCLNYVDARDSIRRDIWWPKLLMELQVEGDHRSSGVLTTDEMKQLVREEESTEKEQGVQKMGSDVELHSTVSGVTIVEKCQKPVQSRRLPRGIKHHAAFFYFESDRDWVNKTVEALDQDYEIVCGKYDLEEVRGLPLFVCLYDIFITSYNIFVIYGFETLQSRQILNELERTTILSKRVVPILLDDCHVGRMDCLNHVDARDSIRRDIWWPKLLMELQVEDHKSIGSLPIDEMKQLVSEETSTVKEQGVQTMDSEEELHSLMSCLTIPAKFQRHLQRPLPPGKNRHASFIYVHSDSEWVNRTVETLEQDYGFVCCEYEIDDFHGIPFLILLPNIIKKSYKIVLVCSREALQNIDFFEIQIALDQHHSNSFVTIMLGDCNIPEYTRNVNYIETRNSIRDIWWPKLLMELDAEGHKKST